MKKSFKFIIDKSNDSSTVKEYLVRGRRISNTCLKRIKYSEDGILVNGKRVYANEQLKTGDLLEINIEDRENSSIIAVEGDLNILFEDDDILAVDKPPYMPVHPSKDHEDDSLANLVINYYSKTGQKSIFRCVTRLDKNTSGIVIIAKNSVSHDRIRRQLMCNSVHKNYLALVHGITDSCGTIDAPIKRYDIASIKRQVAPDGSRAITHYTTLKSENGISLVDISTETGRTHQIRVHMAYIGHPLCGDFLYGNERDGYKRQMLHAYKISFTHPTTNKMITINSNNDRWLYE